MENIEYELVCSRYDGFREFEKILGNGSYEEMVSLQNDICNGGAFIGEDGLQWYSDIIKI